MSRYRRVRDCEELELARVDEIAHRKFRRPEAEWTDAEIREYCDAITTVHADYPNNHLGEVA